jgi:hypothetical protein
MGCVFFDQLDKNDFFIIYQIEHLIKLNKKLTTLIKIFNGF